MLAKSFSTTLCGLAALATATLFQLNAFGQVPARPEPPAIAQPQNGQPVQDPAAPQNALPAPGGDANQGEMKVLDQGPLHEAFAEAVVLENQKPIVINREPPEPINELVPEVRPEGENIEWIPGYWMWSDQQNDFIWVSGVWRDIPPGRRWVPGNWTAIDGGFQWVSGFWAGEQVQEVNMLPLPPETVEAGPSSPAPGANYFWVPGCWIWNNGAYGWRGGYWYAGQQNWVWIPDRYCYTPGGVIFVSGYWDYLLAYRGLAYAPVWWSRPVWGTPGWGYRPYYGINSSLLLSALFLNRHHHHYYFGHGNWNNDFYRPWWKNGGGKGYDPFCSYHRWHDGRNRDDWANNFQRDFNRFQQDFDRPGNGPHHSKLVTQADIRQRQQIGDVRLQQVSKIDLDRSHQQIDQFKNIRNARLDAEKQFKDVRGNGKIGFDDLKNGQLGQNGREAIDRARDGKPNVSGDPGNLAGVVDRDAIRNGGRKLEIGDAQQNPQSGRAAFKLPPVARTTAKVPTDAGNAAKGPQFIGNGQNNGQRGGRTLPDGTARNGSMNGMKFEDLQRQLRNGAAPPTAGDSRRSALPDNIEALPNRRVVGEPGNSGDVIRGGRTLTPNGQNGVPEAFRSRGGVVRSEDLRRQLNLDGSSSFPQGQGRTMEGRARVEMPQNRLQTPGNISRPPEMQYRSRNLQVPGGGPSSMQPRMNPGGQPRINQGGGQPNFRGFPSSGSGSPRVPFNSNGGGGGSGGNEMRSFRGPSGGGGGGGNEMRSFRGPSGDGGGGGQSMMRSRSDSGGGGSAFRSSGGGGGNNGGGGGGRGRGRD